MRIICSLCITVLFVLPVLNYSHAEDVSIDVDDIGDEDIDENQEDETTLVNDPYEKVNRRIFKFNESLDEVINKFAKPGSKPGLVRQGISNFAQNFFEIPRFINYTLQADGGNAINTIGRCLINTCVGFFGLFDVAEKMGLRKSRTTFNDTLKKWGIPSGAFVVLPLLGPTCMRGAVSQVVHLKLDTTALIPLKNIHNEAKYGLYWTSWFFDALNTRSAYGDFLSNIVAMSKDKYKTVRNLIMSMEQ